MKKLAFLVVILAMVLAACTAVPETPDEVTPAANDEGAATEGEEMATEEPAATEEAEEPAETEATEEAEETEEPAETEATEEAGDTDEEASGEEEAPAGTVTYSIVPEESTVTYTVDEQFLNEGVRDATAVGTTNEVEGDIYFDPDNPQNSEVGTITINIRSFESDSERRDERIREEWLESNEYPIATFEPTEIEGLPETYTDGEELTIQIMGDLTVRETTQPTTFETTGVIEGDEMRGTATTQILMTDFGFEPPNILNVLRVEDEVLLTFDFVARAQ
jgi:polyisoprenoid-binding protein YceI